MGSQFGVCWLCYPPPVVAMSVSHDRPSSLLLHTGVDAPPALVTQLKESLENIGNKYGSNKWKNVVTRHSDTFLIYYKKGMGMGLMGLFKF